MSKIRTRIAHIAVASALAVTFGGIAAGPAMAKGQTISAAPRFEIAEDNAGIQASCAPLHKCLMF